MKSRTSSSPVLVVQRVTSTNVPSTYSRVALAPSSAGATSQRPCSGVPSRAPKVDAESYRGRHSQSMLPSRPTSAPVRQSLTSA